MNTIDKSQSHSIGYLKSYLSSWITLYLIFIYVFSQCHDKKGANLYHGGPFINIYYFVKISINQKTAQIPLINLYKDLSRKKKFMKSFFENICLLGISNINFMIFILFLCLSLYLLASSFEICFLRFLTKNRVLKSHLTKIVQKSPSNSP